MMCPSGHEGHAMKTSRFTEEQIAFALKQAELGTKVEEICRKLGISEATFYNSEGWGLPSCTGCASSKRKTRS